MTGLDPAQIVEIRSLIKSLKKNHTVMLSTHILQEVEALADRVILIADGRKRFDGLPSELVRDGRGLDEHFYEMTRSA